VWRVGGQCKEPYIKDTTRTSSRASHEELYKIVQRPLSTFNQDLHKIFSQGIVQDVGQDPRNKSHKTVIKGPAAAAGADRTRS